MGKEFIPKEAITIGQNIKAIIKDNVLIMYVDMSTEIGPSKTGKSFLVASTGGAANITGLPKTKANILIYKPV